MAGVPLLADPVNPTDLVNKQYVDTAVAGAGGMVPLDPTTTEGDLIVRHAHATTALAVGLIGDSITQGAGTGGNPYATGAPSDTLAALLSTHGLTVTAVNQGHGGSNVTDWLPTASNGYYTAAVAAFRAAGVRLVHVMLEVNALNQGTAPTTVRDQLRVLLTNLVGDGFLPVLSGTIATTTAGLNTNIVALQSETPTLRNGVTVLKGDTDAYAYFLAHTGELADGVHPNDTVNAHLGGYWAAALQPYVLALTGPLALARLGIGTSGQALVVAGGAPAWGTPALAASGVAAGTYSNPTLTVDAQGRVTAAATGAPTGYAWEPLVTGLAAQESVTTNGTPGDPVWASNDFVMVGRPYTPN